jgi:hypothetical protein
MDDHRATGPIDPATPAWILRTGGIAALVLAAAYLAIIPLFSIVGAPPPGTLARLEYHALAGSAWWAIVGLSVLTDLLLVPVAVSLYAALGRSNRPAMLVATTFTMLFVALDLAVTWPAYASLVELGRQYAEATGAQRDQLVAAAGYPSAVLSSPLQAIDSILTLSIGILVTGLVMLRGGFGHAPALVGVATGGLGIASVAQTAVTGTISPLAIAASLLTIAWLVLVGRSLLALRG